MRKESRKNIPHLPHIPKRVNPKVAAGDMQGNVAVHPETSP